MVRSEAILIPVKYKEQCFIPGEGRYPYKEFNHIVPVLPPLDIMEQMVRWFFLP